MTMKVTITSSTAIHDDTMIENGAELNVKKVQITSHTPVVIDEFETDAKWEVASVRLTRTVGVDGCSTSCGLS